MTTKSKSLSSIRKNRRLAQSIIFALRKRSDVNDEEEGRPEYHAELLLAFGMEKQ